MRFQRVVWLHQQRENTGNKSFFAEKQMGIQFKRISHQITKSVSFLFEKVITYSIIVLSRKIFKQISEVACNRAHDIWW